LFQGSEVHSKYTILELAKLLQQKPNNLAVGKAGLLARYLIEPRLTTELVYDEQAVQDVAIIVNDLSTLLGSYLVHTEEVQLALQQALFQKLATKRPTLLSGLQTAAATSGYIRGDCLEQLNQKLTLELTPDEIDCLNLTMYQATKDIERLPYQLMLAALDTFAGI
jgi:hypothetical protein